MCYKEIIVEFTTTTEYAESTDGSYADEPALNKVHRTENDLFFIDISGVPFNDPSNKLEYRTIVQNKIGCTELTPTER